MIPSNIQIHVKFLIIKLSALGDIVQTFDALAYLRHKCPFSQIDWIVDSTGAELVRAHPDVDKVYAMNTKQWLSHPINSLKELRSLVSSMPRYHIAFDLQGNCKSALMLANICATRKVGFGKKTVAEWPNYFFTHVHIDPPVGQNIRDDYLYILQQHFHDKQPFHVPPVHLRIPESEKKLIAQIPQEAVIVCPFAAWPNKQLPAEELCQVLKQEQGPFYVAWSTKEERLLAGKLIAKVPDAYLLPKFSIPVLQQLMDRCRKVIAMDSLPLHLCGTTSTSSLSFFGPSSAKKYAPKGVQHTVIDGACPFDEQFEKRCRHLRSCQSAACINKLKSK